MTTLWVQYESSRSGGEPDDPEDRWTSHAPVHISLTLLGLSRTKPSGARWEQIEVDASVAQRKTVFLVVVRYHDGDTFGSSHGHFEFYSVRATRAETKKDRQDINDPAPRSMYRSWDGYFAGLEDVEVHEMNISD